MTQYIRNSDSRACRAQVVNPTNSAVEAFVGQQLQIVDGDYLVRWDDGSVEGYTAAQFATDFTAV